jgi:MAPEG family
MASTLILTSFAFVGISTFVEKKLVPQYIPYLYEPSPVFPSVTRAFGLIILVLTAFSFWLVSFGMTVGKARRECKAAAEKDGEKELEMYSPPFLYASGTSKHAIKLNQVQRAHQHVLESITGVYMTAFFNALVFPITTFIVTALWAYARVVWSNDYATRGAEGRYNNPLAVWIWRGLLMNYITSFFVASCFIFGCPF